MKSPPPQAAEYPLLSLRRMSGELEARALQPGILPGNPDQPAPGTCPNFTLTLGEMPGRPPREPQGKEEVRHLPEVWDPVPGVSSLHPAVVPALSMGH